MVCETCNGSGWDSEICITCNGSGEGNYDGSTCYACGGDGEIIIICTECEEREDEKRRTKSKTSLINLKSMQKSG